MLRHILKENKRVLMEAVHKNRLATMNTLRRSGCVFSQNVNIAVHSFCSKKVSCLDHF